MRISRAVILAAMFTVVSCDSPERISLRAFALPDLPAVPGIPVHGASQHQRAFDRSHISELRKALAFVQSLAKPPYACGKGHGDTRMTGLMKLSAVDPLMEQSWAASRLRKALDLLTVAHTAVGCRDTGPESAPLRRARDILGEVRSYLDSL